MTQQRSNDDIRADLAHYDGLMDPACTDRLVADVAPLLARVSELETERDAYKRAKEENDDRFMLERDEARASAERAEAQRDEALTLLADAVPDPKGAMDSPEWHRRMDALSGLSLQEEQPTHLVGAGGWRACDTAADWAGSDTTGVTCAECLATTTDVLQEEQE